MKTSKVYNSLQECQSVLAQINSHFELPKKGTNIGNGPFVDIPETFVVGAKGWTTEYTGYIEINGKFHIILDSELEALNGTVFDFGVITEYEPGE